MGPQSSGKSTLLNHLFGTNFREMDALNKRGQTTQGIWLAKCPGIKPCTLVMDLEGSDGRERGEDDTAFEKKAALFAFCVSDIVLINMWCHDVGRVQAAIQPLLRSVLEAMGKLFSYRKTTLWFVLRDKSRTPNKILEELLWNDLQQIWDSLANRQPDEGTLLSENFNVKITALTSYEDMEEQFKEEVVGLRQQLFSSITYGGFTGEGRGIVPASGFSFSVEEIWEKIKESKDLNIPPQRILEAIVLCEDIAKKKHASFITNEYWCQLEKDVQSHPVQDFGKKINPILDSYLSEYDLHAKYFDEGVRTEKRKQLKDKLLQIVKPTWQSMLEYIHNGNLDKFKEALREKLRRGGGKFSVDACDCASSIIAQFDKECLAAIIEQASWDSSKFRDKLQKDIDAHVSVVRLSMLSKVLSEHEENLKAALSGPVGTLLVRAGDDMWKEIRIVLGDETKSCFMKFSTALSGFEEDEQTKNRRLKELMDYARGMIRAKARQNAGRVLTHMKDRFERFFIHDSNSNLRVWNGEEDIAAIRQTARSASLKLLCIMAAIRLDEDADDIEKTLFCAFLDSNASPELPVALASDTWEKVPQLNTLITPVECKDIWRQFNEFSETVVIKAQEIVVTIRCAAIASTKLASFIANKDWHKLQKELRSQPVPDFWKKLSLIIDTCLSAYDVETRKFGGVRTEKRRELKEKMLQQACLSMFEHIHSRTLDAFKEAFSEKLEGGEEFYVAARDSTMSSIVKFDEECSVETIENANGESSEFRDKLQHDIDVHIAAVLSSKLSTLSTQYQEKLKKLLQGVISGDNTWQEQSKIYAIQSSFNDFSAALSNSKVDEQTKHKMLENLEDYARGLIQAKARQEAVTVLMDVKDRFERFISDDINSKLPVWSSKEDDLAIRETAHSASLKLHSIMATIRVDDDADDIDKILFSALMDNCVSTKISGRLGPDSKGKVPSRDKLMKPVSVKDCWSQFNEFSKAIVIQAQVTVATVRCEAISCKKLVSFIANENWCQLKQDVQSRPVPDFGKKLNLILDTCLSQYDGETAYFDEGVRTEKKRQLRDGLLLLVRPTCESMFEYVFAGTLEKFKRALDEKLKGEEFLVAARYCTKSFMTQFDEGCRDAIIDTEQWDSLKLRGKLQREFDKYVAALGHSKQSALLSPYKASWAVDHKYP